MNRAQLILEQLGKLEKDDKIALQIAKKLGLKYNGKGEFNGKAYYFTDVEKTQSTLTISDTKDLKLPILKKKLDKMRRKFGFR